MSRQWTGPPWRFHEVGFYRSDAEFGALIVPFVEEGVAASQPVILGYDDRKASLLRSWLYDPGAVTFTVRGSADLRPARSFAVSYADWVGLSQDGIEELQLIATELASNSLLYTDGECQLAFWRHNDHLVCEARDSGRFDDPLVGLRPPGAGGSASRGLFLVNAMADLVRTHTTTSGTTTQAYLRVDPSCASTG